MQGIEKTFEEYKAFKENKYEEKIVKRLLKHYNLPKSVKWQLIDMWEEKYGEKRLGLTFFHMLYPTFPVFLHATRLDRQDRRLSLPDLFKRFDRLPMWDGYHEARDRYSGWEAGKPVGVVFPWAHLGDETIIHDLVVEEEPLGPRMEYPSGGGVVLTVQRLDVFLAEVDRAEGGRWSP